MKVGIIRCMQTEDYCPGTADFLAIRNKSGAFAQLDGETIAFASCIKKGSPMGYSCPFAHKMISMVKEKFGNQVIILEESH